MSGAGKHWEQDKEATVYVGNLDERVTDEIVWELMLQAGRIINVHLPKDRVTQTHQGYGFVEFSTEEDADYAANVMNQVKLWGKPIRVNKASADKQKTLEIGAELFIGNLDPLVDERVLFETFSRFGSLTSQPKIARDEAQLSKGYGFVSFSQFEYADEAIANMHGQFLMNKEISVQYAYKKDGKGERHGDAAERALAKSGQAHNVEPIIQPLPAALVGSTPVQATPIMNGNGPPAGYAMGGAYNGVPPPQQQYQQYGAPPTPAGLPPRPPQSATGYGGPPAPGYPPAYGAPPGAPSAFAPPPGYGQAPGYPPQMNGYGAPPPGYIPPNPNGYPRR